MDSRVRLIPTLIYAHLLPLNNAKVKLYFERCLKLGFDEDPNYSLLKRLFKHPGTLDWNDKNYEIKKIKPKVNISDSGVDTPGTSL